MQSLNSYSSQTSFLLLHDLAGPMSLEGSDILHDCQRLSVGGKGERERERDIYMKR